MLHILQQLLGFCFVYTPRDFYPIQLPLCLFCYLPDLFQFRALRCPHLARAFGFDEQMINEHFQLLDLMAVRYGIACQGFDCSSKFTCVFE